jgi:integrase
MANFKIVFFKSKVYSDKTSPVFLRVTIDRKTKYFPFPDNFKCLPKQWSKKDNEFKSTYPDHEKANEKLRLFYDKARFISMELNKKNNDSGFTFDEFTAELKRKTQRLFVFDYFDQIIERLKAAGKIGNAITYQDTKAQFKSFFLDSKTNNMNENTIDEIEMKSIELKDLNKFVEYCQEKGHKDTTISVRMRTLRALFNRAKKEEKLENYPFSGFNWSQFNLETVKRAISKSDLLKIYNHEIEPGQKGFDSKNYWLFSYFCYGLNFIDVAKLEPKNIVTDEEQKLLVYTRTKTKRIVRVPLSEPALNIIAIYKNQNFGSKYIFPILNPEIHKTATQIKYRVQTALKKVNKEMNQIASDLKIEKHLTSYTARHSFATILKRENIPTAIISEMMAHKNESITQVYLDGFDNETKAAAAKKLI